MKQSKQYFAIGLFVILGFVLFAIGCIVFGGSELFAQKLRFETYFAASVQGLDTGGPVKFRGVKIGSIEEIGFAGTTYSERSNIDPEDAGMHRPLSYVRVVCSVDLKRHPNFNRERLSSMVARGLRSKLELQGITGVVFVNLDFVRRGSLSEDNEPLPVPWEPDNLYIPSVPTTLQGFMNVAESMGRKLDSIDFPKAVESLTSLAQNVDRVVTESNIPKLTASFTELVQSLNQQADRLSDILSKLDTDRLGSNLQAFSDNLAKTSESLRKALPRLAETADNTLQQTQSTLSEADALLREVTASLRTLRQDVDTRALGQDIGETLSALARTGASLEALVDEIRAKPSRLIFDTPAE